MKYLVKKIVYYVLTRGWGFILIGSEVTISSNHNLSCKIMGGHVYVACTVSPFTHLYFKCFTSTSWEIMYRINSILYRVLVIYTKEIIVL